MPCGRNVLVGEKIARAIASDCGGHGKCLSGKCMIDSEWFSLKLYKKKEY